MARRFQGRPRVSRGHQDENGKHSEPARPPHADAGGGDLARVHGLCCHQHAGGGAILGLPFLGAATGPAAAPISAGGRLGSRSRAAAPAPGRSLQCARAAPAGGGGRAKTRRGGPPRDPRGGPAGGGTKKSSEPQKPAAAPEPPPGPMMTYEFRSEKWGEAYGRRIDEMIAVLKSKGVPVLWVGLPAIRGTRSTADLAYLNELYRGHAEKAGIAYVDVWDGFVDENGNFAPRGPDFEGQIRLLRAGDGVHFTKAGARKLAHYVEREIRHLMLSRGAPMALPTPEEPQPDASRPGSPAVPPPARPGAPLAPPPSPPPSPLRAGAQRPPRAGPNATRRLV